MEPSTILALFLICSTAVIFSPLGLGGGIIFMPILHYIMDWNIKTAILGSLILVWSVALGSQFAHNKGGYGDINIAKRPQCHLGHTLFANQGRAGPPRASRLSACRTQALPSPSISA